MASQTDRQSHTHSHVHGQPEKRAIASWIRDLEKLGRLGIGTGEQELDRKSEPASRLLVFPSGRIDPSW